MKALRQELVLILTFLVAVSPVGLLRGSGAADAPATWTIMLYMADDYLPELPWEDNINAMEAADIALGTTIVALVDQLDDGDSLLLRVQQDPNGADPTIVSTPIEDNGEVIPVGNEANMADPETLRDFLEFSTSHYPSTRTVLVLWGHGDGWIGLCPDDTDILTLPELRSALDGTWKPLDMIVVDACAAATFEMLYEVRGLADYFVAAENNVPFQGLPYQTILDHLAGDPSVSASEFGSTIVSDYIQSAWRSSPYSTTMSLFDLSRIEGVVTKLSDLSHAGLRYDDIFHGTLNDAVNDAESYDIPYYFDFGDFLGILQRSDIPLELVTQAIDAGLAYQEMILAFEKFDNLDPVDGIGVTNATGAVIYAPSTSFSDNLYASLGLAGTEWFDFGMASRIVRPTQDREAGPELLYSDSDEDDDDLADAVTVKWPDGFDEYGVLVFRQETGGYAFCDSLVSSTSSITVSGTVGRLLLSATASTGGVARTYDDLSVTLYGILRLTIRAVEDGRASTEDYYVRATVKGMAWSYVAEDGIAILNLSLPSQAEVGNMMLIEVLSPGSDKVLGSERVVVLDHDYAMTVEIHSPKSNASGFYAMMALSILPGALVLAFALMLYREHRRKERT